MQRDIIFKKVGYKYSGAMRCIKIYEWVMIIYGIKVRSAGEPMDVWSF